MSELQHDFWRKPLEKLNRAEWEALCDGCGKCCLNKLEDEESGEVLLTNVACQLFDNGTCQCSKYQIRHEYVPECIVLDMQTIMEHMYWLPRTCAYRLRHEGQDLPTWHPLLTGSQTAMHAAKQSMRGGTVSELDISDDEWEEHIIEEPQ